MWRGDEVILVIDNYDSFVYNIVQRVGEVGGRCVVKRNDKISLNKVRRLKPSHIIISPGPMTPEESGASNDIICEFCDSIPILGVCLGHQCIGKVFGAKIVRETPVHGKKDMIFHDKKEVYDGLKSPFAAGRYHSLKISSQRLPKCLKVTAKNKQGLIMGVRHVRFPVEGLQFHPESIITPVGHKILSNFLKKGEDEDKR